MTQRQTRFDLGPIPDKWEDQVNVIEFDVNKIEFSARLLFDEQLEWYSHSVRNAAMQIWNMSWKPFRPSRLIAPTTDAAGLVSTQAPAFSIWVRKEKTTRLSTSISVVYMDGCLKSEVDVYDFWFAAQGYDRFLLSSQSDHDPY